MHGRTENEVLFVTQTGPRYMIGARYKFGQYRQRAELAAQVAWQAAATAAFSSRWATSGSALV